MCKSVKSVWTIRNETRLSHPQICQGPNTITTQHIMLVCVIYAVNCPCTIHIRLALIATFHVLDICVFCSNYHFMTETAADISTFFVPIDIYLLSACLCVGLCGKIMLRNYTFSNSA